MIDLKNLRVRIGKGQAEFPMEKGCFLYDDKILETQAYAGPVHVETISPQEKRLTLEIDPAWNRIWITLPTDARHFYGGGETFSEWDLAGQRIRVWVAEHQNAKRIEKKMERQAERGIDPLYKGPFDEYESYYAQPTIMMDTKEYIHVDGTSFMAFDFRTPGQITIEMYANAPIYFGSAASFPELSALLTSRLGRQAPLPDWAHDGVILGIQQGPEVIDRKIAQARAQGVPVVGVWSQDWCGCRRTAFGYQVMWNWTYDKDLYPDLPDKIRKWKAEGVRFLGYINPFMAIEKELYQYASAHGYCVKNDKGEDYLVTITTFPAAMIDLTNPEAYAWYKQVIKDNMIGIGMGGWMADFGEYLPVDSVLYSGQDASLLHNEWPAIWARLNREAVRECGKEGEIFFFTRAGFTGTVRESTLMWNGDQHVDWSLDDGLASVIPATLSLAVCGCGLTHSDVGGYTTNEQMNRSKELLMRWEEMNIFSPLMRSHEGNQPTRNVQFDADEELLRHLGACGQVHRALKPYLQALEQENYETGVPVMRPLFYHYEEEAAFTEKYEYLLGRDLLVAPVITEGADTRDVYLPQDEWIHVWSGRAYTGGTVTVEAPLGQPPVFVRAASWVQDLLQALMLKM